GGGLQLRAWSGIPGGGCGRCWSSAVANGVLGLVFGVVTTLVVDMAFLIQANTYEELSEQVISAVRLAHVKPASAIVPQDLTPPPLALAG
ncbi:Os09g0107600, partial [Oryza sativa Japonica Group]